MSPIRLILASLWYHWRMHVAVGCGVVAGTAVLTGALLVGDSMRGSLRDLTLDRLGRIDEVLVAERFFRAELPEELAASPGFGEHFTAAVPAILLRASLENPDAPARANQVNLLGCDRQFWELGPALPEQLPKSRQVVLNRPLADELHVAVGDQIILRLPRITTVPADTPLGRKNETVSGHRVTVSAIVPAEGLGRFALRPTQHLPLNAYVAIDWLQDRLQQPDRVNAILVAGKDARTAPSPESEGVLQTLLQPRLADYGIRLEETDRGYLNVTSDRMLLEPAAEEAILESLRTAGVQPALTYLANTIACGDREVPYSTITAIDFDAEPPLGPLATAEGKPIPTPGKGEIVLNTWAAEDLQANKGDRIRVTYFEPESVDGQVRERTEEFRLVAVAGLAGAADDPALTPEVPGVTDRLSMADWDPPFPFDAGRIRDKDEQYWEDHKATPKAFVSLATGRQLWQSRFGRTTSLRVPTADGDTAENLQARLSLDPRKLGFVFQPVKRQGLAASVGTTSFNLLFLGFSMFIIAAAVLLVALLFRLGVDGRAAQIGILLAVGLGRRQINRLFAGEGLAVAALASLLGVAAGVGYAALMLVGLETLWLEAVVTPFLRLHVTSQSLVIGYVSGVTVSFAAIAWSVRRIARIAPQRLLAGQPDEERPLVGARPRYAGKLAVGMLLAAIALSLAAARLGEEARAGAFFGAGAMVLVACLATVWTRLRSGATGPAVAPGRGNVLRMALRNAARNPARSTLTIALVAAACFLIVSVSAFRLDPTTQVPKPVSGNGGFALVGESAQPIYRDLNTPSGRAELGFSPDDSKLLEQTTTYALRVKPGDDASCLNLYKPREPRILGVPAKFIHRGGFVFTASNADTEAERNNPWLLLQEKPSADADGPSRVPVVLDDSTAKYSLHLGLGQTLDVTNGRGQTVPLEIVGLLKTSIFQGDVLMSEATLLEHFPETSGYRFFLVETPPEQTDRVQNLLERTLGDYGFAAETAGNRLAGFLAVQNTYLSTFQSLGGLGLLLGTLGLAAVELRNVLERRGELGLLRASGFRRRLLAWLVMLENGLLLVAGLAAGVIAAAVAVLPHLFAGGASIPWGSLAGTLALVLAVGLIAGLAAVRAVLTTPLLAALRQE